MKGKILQIKKISVFAMALFVLCMISPAIAAPATKTSVTGEFFGYATAPGTQWITEGGIVQIRDGAGEGIVTGELSGSMAFTMNAAFDLTTGKGRAWGKFVCRDNDGKVTFEGTWLMSISYWGNSVEGKSAGHGTGAYEGMLLKNPFWGYNAYFGLPITPYPKGTPIYFYYEGTIISQ